MLGMKREECKDFYEEKLKEAEGFAPGGTR